MTLLNVGYWQTTYYPENYWEPHYWQAYGAGAPPTVTPSVPTGGETPYIIPRRPPKPRLNRDLLTVVYEYLHMKIEDQT